MLQIEIRKKGQEHLVGLSNGVDFHLHGSYPSPYRARAEAAKIRAQTGFQVISFAQDAGDPAAKIQAQRFGP